jgi:mannosyl-oligosaccharide glucosidase
MARQRKPLSVGHSDSKYLKKSPSHTKKDGGFLSYWKQGLAFICLVFAGVIGYMGYLETRVNTPFDEQKVCTERKDLVK